MSTSATSPESIERRSRPSLQPYQCQICQSRFTRQENLKRHSALHTRSPHETPLPCGLCDATFSRPDLRHRHIKRKHQDQQSQSAQRRRSPPSSLPDVDADMGNELVDIWRSGIPVVASPAENRVLPSQDDWFPSDAQVAHGCVLFFDHISAFLPFIHKPTFVSWNTPGFLLLSILSLAYQYGDDPDSAAGADTGVHLAERCFHQARRGLATCHNDYDDDFSEDHDGNTTDSINRKVSHDGPHRLAIVQSYLMLQICAIMYMCGKTSSFGLKTHSKMILLARAEGLLRPLAAPDPGTTRDLDALWRQFLRIESHKRTLFAIHQVDALWYQFLSIPRQLSHLEIKHPLPCPQDLWNASSSTEWAHRKLVNNTSQPSPAVQYTEAVRRFLSSDPHLDSLPPFDPYGAINLTQFLISSAQEISGWCTMTGVLSTKRLEPLRSSLLALSPYVWSDECQIDIRTNGLPTATSSSSLQRNILCEATWASAMIDIQTWSPSHTSGIVGTSMDAVLNQLTCLAPSSDFLCESNIAQMIQPHIDWFLHYLDSTVVLPGEEQRYHYQHLGNDVTNAVAAEAPWVTLYAYKAFMIAWQLVRGGVPGAMSVVEVEDGDMQGALGWAVRVFGRRRRWQLGRLVMECLNTLGQ